VMGRLNGGPAPTKSSPAPSPTSATPTQSCGCDHAKKNGKPAPALRGKYGVFQDANEACVAAHESFLQLQEKGVAARRKIEEIVKSFCDRNAAAWGKLELDETKIGRLD